MGNIPPIKGFIETSFLDWPGKVCSVLFLPYCNFRCPFCHNHVLVTAAESLESISLDTVLNRIRSMREWIDGVCISGGEPTIHPELLEMIKVIREEGFKIKLDTNGTQPETLRHLIMGKFVDEIAMDVKGPLDDISYSACAGVPVPVELIRKSINLLLEDRVPYTFRTTVVPSLLPEDKIYEMAKQLRRATGLTLQNFNPVDPMDSALKTVAPYSEEKLTEIQEGVDEIIQGAKMMVAESAETGLH
ncbi:MAG: anaerobic ribonucleoside-triphosphate reductase activating protein [Deltaproteobacteria bacterium]|nr:anaerobic ribonucleoside-triphosphate reductase activating protein [Deltaproteobacteria bacterium]